MFTNTWIKSYRPGKCRSPQKLENGKTITMTACGNSPENRYIKTMKVNGRSYDRNYLEYGDLAEGADIVFTMSANPDTSRGTGDAARPYSFCRE